MTHFGRAFAIMSLTAFGTGLADPATADQLTFGVERGTGRIICTDDNDSKANEDDPSYAISAAWDARIFGAGAVPCYAPLTELDPGVWLQSEPFSGEDEQGGKADFRIYVLHDTYSWKIGSTWEVELNGETADPKNIYEAPNFNERFCGANAAFAFGASSHEGPAAANHRASAARATTIVNSLKSVRTSCDAGRIPIVFGVNLGEHVYESSCTNAACSAKQRRVIIISADKISVGVDLAAALSSGIKEQRVFDGLDVDKYDLFEVASF